MACKTITATLGVAEHSNSATFVTIATGGALLDRRHAALTENGLPTHPHHHEGSWAVGRYLKTPGARALSLNDAVALVDRVRALAQRGAHASLEALAASVTVPISLPAFEHVLREHLQQLDTFADRSASNERPKSAAATFEVAKAVVAGERKFGALHVPILAIYALPHNMGAGNTHAAEAEARDTTCGTGPQARAFEAAVPSARVVRLPHAGHYVFRSNEVDVLREMRAFIERLPN